MVNAFAGEGTSDWQLCVQDLADVLNEPVRPYMSGVPPLGRFERLNRFVEAYVAAQVPGAKWQPEETRQVLAQLLLEVADDDYGQSALVVAKTLLGLREPPDLDAKIPNPLSASSPFLDLTLRELHTRPYMPKREFRRSIKVRRAYVAPLFVADSVEPTTYRNDKSHSPIWSVADGVLKALLDSVVEVAKSRVDGAGKVTPAVDPSEEGISPPSQTGSHQVRDGEGVWHRIAFESAEDESRLRAFAQELIETVPRAIKECRETLAGTPLLEAHTVQEALECFDLLTEISHSLDRFEPTIFERDLDELKQATDTRPRPESLRSLLWDRSTPTGAWAYVRPGVKIEDLDAALAKLQAQKAAWRDMAHPFTLPRIPVGVSQAKAQMQAARKALEQLDEMLDRTGEEGLTRLPFEEVTQGLYQLAAGGK